MPVLAGTIPCPTCNNRPTVIRHTPNLEKFFRLERPWTLSVSYCCKHLRISFFVHLNLLTACLPYESPPPSPPSALVDGASILPPFLGITQLTKLA